MTAVGAPTVKFTTTRRADRIEAEIENLRRSVSTLTEIVADMRAVLFPVPPDVVARTNLERIKSSGVAVREIHGV